jgi:hypothetical protein
MKIKAFLLIASVIIAGSSAFSFAWAKDKADGAEFVKSHGYDGCVRLSNGKVEVILEPNCGGRVIEYAINGKNALYLNPEHDGYIYKPGEKTIDPSGGRCYIGPEMKVKYLPDIWLGKWEIKITGPRSARLTSIIDKDTGIRLVRDFRLDKSSSKLIFTQTIENHTDSTLFRCHWSRTFATGGGICLVPLTPNSRFPLGYIMYGPGSVLNYQLEPSENVHSRDGFLEITGTPPQPKFGVDTHAGWLAYITKDDLLIVKKFKTFPERAYGEVAAYTVSIWYYKEQMCELEPIGPLEKIKPGGKVSFTEEWFLFPYNYPADKKPDLNSLKKFVASNAE